MRILTNIAKASTIVTLYQAGEQLYNFFDKVLLIHEGRCLYFGPAEQARQYFIDMGYEAEKSQTTADFLTSITDKGARRVRAGLHPPQTSEQFEKYYKDSPTCKRNIEDMQSYDRLCQGGLTETSKNVDLAEVSKPRSVYSLPFHKQVWYCTLRQYQINFGDKFALYGKSGSTVFLSLIIGSSFYNMPRDTNGACKSCFLLANLY